MRTSTLETPEGRLITEFEVFYACCIIECSIKTDREILYLGINCLEFEVGVKCFISVEPECILYVITWIERLGYYLCGFWNSYRR